MDPLVAEIPESHRDLLESEFATLGTVRNLRARPACSVLVLDLQNPYRYLEIRGRARIEADADYAFADRVGQKYDSDLRRHDRPGETRVIVTVEPEKVHAVDMSG
jgi:hypothetical protein